MPTLMQCLILGLVTLMSIRLAAAQKGESSAQLTVTQGEKTITITEPGIWDLRELFKRADIVAYVYVLSGDTEAYESITVHKAKVIQGFKGAAREEILYFGPFARTEVGGEYILFLIKDSAAKTPEKTSSLNYGTIRYARVFDEGYSSMHVDYQCLFDGKDTSQQCDYGVRACTDYIKLPSKMHAFPPESENVPFGCRWVRKNTFISHLEALGKTAK